RNAADGYDGTTSFDVTDTGTTRPAFERLYSEQVIRAHVQPSFTYALPKSCYRWFASNKLERVTGLENLNTSQVTNMSSMLEGCQATELAIQTFDTYNVTDMSAMFKDCSLLTTLDISHLNTGLVTTMKEMFSGCKSLQTLDVRPFKTFSVESMQSMFFDCAKLEEIDLNNFNTDKLQNIAVMFGRCGRLHTIWCDNSWSEIEHYANMFTGCESLKGAVPYKESMTTLDGR
ncbi:MAG: BspA family leucine-rich repeat surface protein, partial [Alloprevotella sp.]|nr:BspA family leucine-rich repeat surface protein [Alloprevotella sp.]